MTLGDNCKNGSGSDEFIARKVLLVEGSIKLQKSNHQKFTIHDVSTGNSLQGPRENSVITDGTPE